MTGKHQKEKELYDEVKNLLAPSMTIHGHVSKVPETVKFHLLLRQAKKEAQQLPADEKYEYDKNRSEVRKENNKIRKKAQSNPKERDPLLFKPVEYKDYKNVQPLVLQQMAKPARKSIKKGQRQFFN